MRTVSQNPLILSPGPQSPRLAVGKGERDQTRVLRGSEQDNCGLEPALVSQRHCLQRRARGRLFSESDELRSLGDKAAAGWKGQGLGSPPPAALSRWCSVTQMRPSWGRAVVRAGLWAFSSSFPQH